MKSQGILPVAVVVPTRGSVHHLFFGSDPIFATYNETKAVSEYLAFVQELRRAGFVTPNLLRDAAGDPPFFLKRDHHWSPAGARRSAQHIAESVNNLYSPASRQPFKTHYVGSAWQKGTLQARGERCCGWLYPEELIPLYKTRAAQDETANLGDALFGQVDIPIVLVGTSNSMRGEGKPEVNFSGFLREALRQDLVNFSFPGAGLFGSLEAYLMSDTFPDTAADVLIWETLYMGWHNNNFLAEVRQVIPSVYGPCQKKALRYQTDSPEKELIRLADDVASLGLAGSDYYLHLAFEDTTVFDFTLYATYQKDNERLDISRSTRAPNTGDYYLELMDGLGSLERLTLKMPRPLAGGLTMSICAVP